MQEQSSGFINNSKKLSFPLNLEIALWRCRKPNNDVTMELMIMNKIKAFGKIQKK